LVKAKVQTRIIKIKKGHGQSLAPVTIQNLTNGKSYYFNTLAVKDGILGDFSTINKVIVGMTF
jgi:hypothetical protein